MASRRSMPAGCIWALPALRPRARPQGGIELLDHYGIEIEGRRAVVIGRSNVVGRPSPASSPGSAPRHGYDLPPAHRRPPVNHQGRPSILCVAAGHAGLVTRDMVEPGAVVIGFRRERCRLTESPAMSPLTRCPRFCRVRHPCPPVELVRSRRSSWPAARSQPASRRGSVARWTPCRS